MIHSKNQLQQLELSFTLTTSILISVPSFNTLMHGTHMVTGHAMGTELGIDTMILFGAVTFLLGDLYQGSPSITRQLNAPATRRTTIVLNTAIAVLVGWLSVAGLSHGISRYYGEASPEWVAWGPYIFPIAGGALALVLLHIVFRWGALLIDVEDQT